MLAGVPWWVFLAILFIFFSGLMAYRAMRAERVLEQQTIEQEGRVYMERIAEERELRQRSQ